MMNMAKGTLSTGCWLRQVNGGGIQQTAAPQMAQYITGGAPDGLEMLMLIPMVMMVRRLEADIYREWGVAYGIVAAQAQELDEAYLSGVNRFEDTVRDAMDRICWLQPTFIDPV